MEPATACALGLASGAAYCSVGLWIATRRGPEQALARSHDFYVLAWYALSVTGFVAALEAGLAWAGTRDVALVATLRVALVLSFALAVAALLAAGAHATRRAAGKPHPKV